MPDFFELLAKSLWDEAVHAKNELVHGKAKAAEIKREKAAKWEEKDQKRTCFAAKLYAVLMTVIALAVSAGNPVMMFSSFLVGPATAVVMYYLMRLLRVNPYK